MKGLFYSQFIKRNDLPILSLSLIKGLLHNYEIDFLYGSPAPRPLFMHPHFRILQMPPFHGDVRTDFFKKELQPPYDFFITEIFPFGKFYLEKEISFLIDQLKCPTFCSLPDSYEGRILKGFLEKYDAFLCHSDPNILPCEHEFPKLDYTGFIPNALEEPVEAERKKRFLIPLGAIAKEFAQIVLPIVAQFSEYESLFILPETIPPILEDLLATWAKSHPHFRILPFQKSLVNLMRSSALVIALPDAPLIDLLESKTKGLILDIGPPEKIKRAKRLADQGVISIIPPKQKEFFYIINELLQNSYPNISINTRGSNNSIKLIDNILNKMS